jgi:drug/metabolite transporter (DMT)-like permease
MRAGLAAGTTQTASLAVGLSAIAWGLWWIAIRWLDSLGLTGHWASVAVFTVASLVLLPVIVLRGRLRGAFQWRALCVGLLLGACFVTWNYALIFGDVVRVTLLFYLAPVWGTILGLVFFGSRLRLLRVATLALGLVGALIVLRYEWGQGLPYPQNAGEWMGLVSGFIFAASAAAALKLGHTEDLERTFTTFFMATILALILAFWSDIPAPAWADVGAAIPVMLGLAALWYVPATWLLLVGAARLDPGRVSILLLLEVAVATLSAGLLTEEPLGWREAIGGFMIIAAGALEAFDEIRQLDRFRRIRSDLAGTKG